MFSDKRKPDPGFWPGNYPAPVWQQVRALLGADDTGEYVRYVTQELNLRLEESPFLMLVDIDGFTDFCKSNKGSPERIIGLLEGFFGVIGSRVGFGGGEVLKFIGDAVFAFAPTEAKAKELTSLFLSLYNSQIKPKFGTDIAIVVTKPERVLRGFVGGPAHMDYSYWGPEVNHLFKSAKQVAPGGVYFVQLGSDPVKWT